MSTGRAEWLEGTWAGGAVETVRRQNLSLVLSHLHRDGALSRADLTRRTGLNRSTVAALVGDLTGRGLVVVEEPPSSGSAGRPSPIRATGIPTSSRWRSTPRSKQLAVALVGMTGRVRAERRHRLYGPCSGPSRPLRRCPRCCLSWPPQSRPAGIVGAGVAVPGLVRAADGVVEWAPHLGWTDAPVADLFAEAIGLPVAVGNDATLGAIAEHLFGAGRGVSDLVYLNGGASGIGGGVVVQDRPLAGAGGFAGEFGHLLLPEREPPTRGRAGGQPRSAGGRA